MRHRLRLVSLAIVLTALIGPAVLVWANTSSKIYLPQVSYSPTPSPTPSPPPMYPILVASSRSYMASTILYVVGEVVNFSTTPAYFVTIDARFYNEAGERVASARGYSFRSQLDAQQRSPFRIGLSPAPAGIVRYELTVSNGPTSAFKLQPVTVVSSAARGTGPVEVYGHVRNDTTSEIRGVSVFVTFYDSSGNVVDVAATGGSIVSLQPGAVAAYSLWSVDENLEYVTYTVTTEGRVP